MKRRVEITLEQLIKDSRVEKRTIAKKMGISPQWLSVLLAKPQDELTIKQLRSIVHAIGLELTVSIDVLV